MTTQSITSPNLILQTQNKYHDAISKICHPLFNKTPIKYFDYTRYYDSGEMATLGTDPYFTSKFYENGVYPAFEEFGLVNSFGLNFIFMTHYMPQSSAYDINPDKYENNIATAADSRIFHRLYFIKRHENFYTLSGFGVKSNIKSILNFYLNSLANLENFLKYFEHHANDLIAENAQNHRIILPCYHNTVATQLQSSDDVMCIRNINFSTEEKPDNSLKSRERECLELIAHGFTMKNSAKKLGISPRTVEQHLRNIKEKHCLSTKNQLVEIWHDIYKIKSKEDRL